MTGGIRSLVNKRKKSKQMRWQECKRAQGLCIICGRRKLYKSWRCRGCYPPFAARCLRYAAAKRKERDRVKGGE